MIDVLIERMTELLEPMEAANDPKRIFHATYLRTTIAVAERIKAGGFDDSGWVERWDVAFAGLYLDALEADLAGRKPALPWQIAFGAPAGLPALRHVLLGMNAHINYDLPQALLAVITDEQFDDAALLARREADHQAIDDVLASRVAAEDDELTRLSGPGPLLDRLLRPFNRLGTQRFLREARRKVWANAIALGSPTRFGSLTSELRAFVDTLGGLWFQGKLYGKAAGAFTSTSTLHGGNETTLLSTYISFAHFGMVIVPPGYGDPVMFRAGTPYGASSVSHGQSQLPPTEDDLAVARFQGRRLAQVASALDPA